MSRPKPVVLFTRPFQWKNMHSRKLKLVHAPVFGNVPVLRSGGPMGDSVGGVTTEGGLKKLKELFEEHKPDFFLYWAWYNNDGSKLQINRLTNVLVNLRTKYPNTVFVYGNGNQQGFPDFNVNAFKNAIDLILLNTHDEREKQMYMDFGVPFVDTMHTFGFDPDYHGKFTRFAKEPKFDCFFGGSQSYNPTRPMKYPKSRLRLSFLEAVNKEFKLLVRGKGKWPFPTEGYLDGNDYIQEFGRTKLTLGMYHWDLERYYTKRTIYSIASGRPYIVHYIPGMEKDFINKKHLAWFHTPEECMRLIDYYLSNITDRLLMGQEGREHAVAHHSWQARLNDFEAIVERFLS